MKQKEILEAILSGDLSEAQDLFNESIREPIQSIINETRKEVAAEVFGVAIVEGNDDKDDKSEDDNDGDDDEDKSDKDKKPPFTKKDDE